MNENMSDMIQKLLNGNEIPQDVQNMLDSIVNNSKENNNSHTNTSASSNDYNTNSDNNFDFDINTILKIKSLMDSVNNEKNNVRSNFLRSLKPYLKTSRQEKIEQYIQLFNMEKVFELINLTGGGNKNDT